MPIVRCDPKMVVCVKAKSSGAGKNPYVVLKNGAELGPMEFAAVQQNPWTRHLLATGELKVEKTLEEVIAAEFAKPEPGDAEDIEEARAEFKAGESISTEELLEELEEDDA